MQVSCTQGRSDIWIKARAVVRREVKNTVRSDRPMRTTAGTMFSVPGIEAHVARDRRKNQKPSVKLTAVVMLVSQRYKLAMVLEIQRMYSSNGNMGFSLSPVELLLRAVGGKNKTSD